MANVPQRPCEITDFLPEVFAQLPEEVRIQGIPLNVVDHFRN